MGAPEIMQSGSHTWIGIVREAVEAWRKQNGWSRETVAQIIVDAHADSGMDKVSGIVFDPHTHDTYARMKVNADRIFRWLDEVTKDRNLLPANFIPSILAALPEDLRLRASNRMLLQVGIACRHAGTEADADVGGLLKSMLSEAAEAERALLALLDGVDPGELETAHKEIGEAITVCRKALQTVESMMLLRQARGE